MVCGNRHVAFLRSRCLCVCFWHPFRGYNRSGWFTCDYKHLFIQIVLSVDRLFSSPFWFPLFFNGFTCWMTHYWLGVWLKSVKMNCKLLSLTVLPYSIHHITKLLFYFIWPLPWSMELRRMTSWCVSHLPASHHQLSEYIKAQAQDAVCSQIMRYCTEGWPDKHKILPVLKPYWKLQGELTVHNNLLLFRTQIVVPNALQRENLQKIHNGHQGIQRCRLRAQSSVWWPGISQHISDLIENCHVCAKKSKQYHEPLMSTPLPDYPWQRVASDLFFLGSDSYLLIVDYFSRYPEVIKLKSTTSRGIIEAMKAVFSRYGIPQTVRSDNGPQYSSEEFSKFAAEYNFYHETSSPHFAQSNG